MKIIATILGLAFATIAFTGCSTSASVGHDGHSHGVHGHAGRSGAGVGVH